MGLIMGYRLPCFMLLLLFMNPAPIYAESTQKDIPTFTNKDIEQYMTPSDNKSYIKIDASPSEKKRKARKTKNDAEKEYWCKKATQYKDIVTRKSEAVAELEKELTAEKNTDKKKKAIEKKIVFAKKQLKYAERDLENLENEAHRKGVPPGWLRCQFE